MKRCLLVVGASILILTISGIAQEVRNEVSVQGTGFFTKDMSGNGVSRSATETGGFEVGYRYHINYWLSVEGNYGFDRNTQRFFSGSGESGVQSDIHAITADMVVNVPIKFKRFSPYVLAGGGGLIFHPTDNRGGSVSGADTQGKGTFLYGGGTDYVLTKHFSLRAEYRGYVYKNPDFNLASLHTGSWTHTAQPSAGFVYSF